MILLRNFINIFYIAELLKKLIFTLGILIVYRIGVVLIPLIGVDINQLRLLMERGTGLGGVFKYIDMFSGGSLSQGSLFALGITPYITASIMMQILTLSVPTLELLIKEGEYGKKLINEYTRYLALGIAFFQSLGVAFLLERYGLVLDPGWGFRLACVFSLTIGSMFVMWLGEQISLRGIGNGSSMIIFAGIVSCFPSDILRTIGWIQNGDVDPLIGLVLLLLVVGMAGAIVYLEKGDRKIPVQYTRRIIGQRMYAGQSSYIPFKINTAGVMPTIFSHTVLNIPIFITSLLAARFLIFQTISQAITPGGLLYNVLDFFLIIFFSFFYTAIQYNSDELAENIKKQGGFIPGIRPGKKTAEYFNYILTRIGLTGAIYLAALAIFPNFLQHILKLPSVLSIMNGTSLLIMVGVALETAAQIESYLIEHRYEGFLTGGRLKDRR